MWCVDCRLNLVESQLWNEVNWRAKYVGVIPHTSREVCVWVCGCGCAGTSDDTDSLSLPPSLPLSLSLSLALARRVLLH